MSNRYNKMLFVNNAGLYRNYFYDRQVPFIRQYSYPTITYPSTQEIQELNLQQHIWTQGDRFYKLALTYYSNYRYWWLIPWFNQKPLESDYKLGDIVYIPLPLNDVLALT